MKKRLRHALAGLFVLALFWSAPALAEWRRAESPNFIVYGESSEARLRERILLLEQFHSLLVSVTTVDSPPAPNKFNVYIVSGRDDLARVSDVPNGVAGFYSATTYGIAAFVDAASEASAQEVLFHEYAHHFMWQYAPTAYPSWYVEGFAEYYMPTQFQANQASVGLASALRGWSVLDGRWIPMERVLFETHRELSREERQRFYTQAWMLVHFFNSDAELRAKLRRFLAAVRQGGEPRQSFERETGFTMATLTRALRSYFGDGNIPFRRYVVPPTPPPPVTITTLPRSANGLLLYEAALRIGSSRDRLLEQVRTAAARNGADFYAQRVLAHAEVMLGDRAAGERLLDALLQGAPNDAELLYLRGMRYLREAEQGEWEGNAGQAARWFARAHRVDANHYPTLYRYAQSLRGRESYDSENTANILFLAYQLAPQVVEIRMNTAAMLIRRGDFDLAEAMLAPLAADPHSESLAEAARQLLEQARQARAAAPPAAATPQPAAPTATPPRQ